MDGVEGLWLWPERGVKRQPRLAAPRGRADESDVLGEVVGNVERIKHDSCSPAACNETEWLLAVMLTASMLLNIWHQAHCRTLCGGSTNTQDGLSVMGNRDKYELAFTNEMHGWPISWPDAALTLLAAVVTREILLKRPSKRTASRCVSS